METLTKNDVKVWSVDSTHSSIHFAVKHMVIAQTKGSFADYKLKVESEGDDFSNAKIELEIEVNSINTSMPDRDNHLRSADFFDAEKYPAIKFVSKSMTKVTDEDYKLTGDITIKGITRPIEFNVNYGGQLVDPWGNTRAGFTIEGAIDRFDFGLNWNSLLEAGGAVVGKTVKLQAEIELVAVK
ncbi:MAG: YceI family protein [Bacteroidia bacterium]|jgi:polyisoprenoid-binding protein YceI